MKKEFLVVFEQENASFGAQAPDIPGCFAVGTTLHETRQRFIAAAESHLQWLANDHDPIPEPTATTVEFAHETGSSYYVEWLAITMPVETRHALSA